MPTSTAVVLRLTGSTVLTVWKVGLAWNTVYTHTTRRPQMPKAVSRAGSREMPKPRR